MDKYNHDLIMSRACKTMTDRCRVTSQTLSLVVFWSRLGPVHTDYMLCTSTYGILKRLVKVGASSSETFSWTMSATSAEVGFQSKMSTVTAVNMNGNTLNIFTKWLSEWLTLLAYSTLTLPSIHNLNDVRTVWENHSFTMTMHNTTDV